MLAQQINETLLWVRRMADGEYDVLHGHSGCLLVTVATDL